MKQSTANTPIYSQVMCVVYSQRVYAVLEVK